MSWEETVLNEQEMAVIARESWQTRFTYPRLATLRQAEKTWHSRDSEIEDAKKLGYDARLEDAREVVREYTKDIEKAGMEKVVKWVNTHWWDRADYPEWQSFLKENGIE